MASRPHYQPRPISELVATATRIEAGNYELELWADGTYFVRAPSGEGTAVSGAALAVKLRELFEEHF
jgi:hypothetical protein